MNPLDDPELEERLRARTAELALDRGCWPHELSARAHEILRNLVLDVVRIERDRAAAAWDDDRTPTMAEVLRRRV